MVPPKKVWAPDDGSYKMSKDEAEKRRHQRAASLITKGHQAGKPQKVNKKPERSKSGEGVNNFASTKSKGIDPMSREEMIRRNLMYADEDYFGGKERKHFETKLAQIQA